MAGAPLRASALLKGRARASPATTSSRSSRRAIRSGPSRKRARARRATPPRATASSSPTSCRSPPTATAPRSFTLKDLPPVSAAEPDRRRGELQRSERRDADRRRRGSTSGRARWCSACAPALGEQPRPRQVHGARARHRRQADQGRRASPSRAASARSSRTRKRMVGGFYAYDNRTEVKELGALCSGTTDDRGLLLCEATLDAAGQVELIAERQGRGRHPAAAAATVWITRQGELWFAQDNDDRIDVLPEKKRYEPGETARLQVRMPFREATALVAVEREGVIATQVATLRGDDPTVELKVEPGWGPERLRQRAGPARPDPRRAVVLVLHLGLAGAGRVVARFPRRRQRLAGADRDGRPAPSRRSSSASPSCRSASPRTARRSACTADKPQLRGARRRRWRRSG